MNQVEIGVAMTIVVAGVAFGIFVLGDLVGSHVLGAFLGAVTTTLVAMITVVTGSRVLDRYRPPWPRIACVKCNARLEPAEDARRAGQPVRCESCGQGYWLGACERWKPRMFYSVEAKGSVIVAVLPLFGRWRRVVETPMARVVDNPSVEEGVTPESGGKN